MMHIGTYERLWDGTGRWRFKCSCGYSCEGERAYVELKGATHDLNMEGDGANAQENNNGASE